MSFKIFVQTLKDLKHTQSIAFLKYPDMFFEAMNELDTLIGMEKVKEDIVSLIKVLLIGTLKKTGTGTNSRLLHTIIFGGPGTGKTILGNIICKIYTSLDLLKKPDKLPSDGSDCEKSKRQCLPGNIDELIKRSDQLNHVTDKINKHQQTLISIFNNLDSYNRGLPLLDLRKYNIQCFIRDIRILKIEVDSIFKEEPELKLKEPSESPPIPIFKVCSRADLVDQYLGGTAIKTRKLLNSVMGGVLFIDEAYELFQNGYSGGDAFGGEALAVIIEYMTRYNENIAIIFGGYEDAIKNTILKGQQGLKSRIGYSYNITPYSEKELVEIFKFQLDKSNWEIESLSDGELVKLFNKKMTNGRDTQNLVSKCIDAHATVSFKLLEKREPIIFKINKEMLQLGIKSVAALSSNLSETFSVPPEGIYL